MWIALSTMLLAIGLANVAIGIVGHTFYHNLFAGGVCILLGIGYFILSHPLRKKIRKLKKEKTVME